MTQNLTSLKDGPQSLVQEEFVDAVKTQLSASNGPHGIQKMFTVDLNNSAVYQGGFEIQQNDNGCCYISKDLPQGQYGDRPRRSNADLEHANVDNSFGTFEYSHDRKHKERSFGMPTGAFGTERDNNPGRNS